VPTYYIARIELKRVQTYLFEVPRLSVMLGANVLLGEWIRGVWMGTQFKDDPTRQAASLPALAVRCGASFPQMLEGGGNWFEDFWKEQLVDHILGKPLFERITAADATKDPLSDNEIVQDSPYEIAIRTGVLVRDASRVEAVFPDSQSAVGFLEQTKQLLLETIPEIDAEASVWQIDGDEGPGVGQSNEIVRLASTAGTAVTFDLPDAKPCELSQHAVAQDQIRMAKNESIWVASSVKRRHDAALRFNERRSTDVLGLMYDSIFKDAQRLVTEFAQLARSGLAAIIHADGNKVGKRPGMISDAIRDSNAKLAKNSILEWSVREAMFLNNRRSVRRALKESIEQLRDGTDRGNRPRNDVSERIRLLMLGGDDILIVCDAPLAIPLMIQTCNLLTEYSTCEVAQASLNRAFEPLTLGIGIAFVKPSLPFRRAHELAEQLAGSAKRLAGRYPDSHVIDWCVSKNSWLDTPDISRRNEFVVKTSKPIKAEYLLSGRPYRVHTSSKEWTFSRLWNDARELAGDGLIARSQLRSLETALVSGPASAVVAIQDLPASLRAKLQAREYIFDQSNGLMGSVWQDCGSTQKLNRLLDLIELYEIARLDQGTAGPQTTVTERGSNHE